MSPLRRGRRLDVVVAPERVEAVVREMRSRGFFGVFTFTPDGRIRCSSCRCVVSNAELAIHASRRVRDERECHELLVVHAATCPICSTGGSLAVIYEETSRDEGATDAASRDDDAEFDREFFANPPYEVRHRDTDHVPESDDCVDVGAERGPHRADGSIPVEAGSEFDVDLDAGEEGARPANAEDARQRPPVAPSHQHGSMSESRRRLPDGEYTEGLPQG